MPKSLAVARAREKLLSTYNHLYKKHHCPMGRGGCFYCGEPYSQWDHIPPITRVEERRPEDWKRAGYKFWLVKSCKACNMSLGNKRLFTTQDRLEYLERRLSDKYEKGAALWSKKEKDEMSPMFQIMIEGRQVGLRILIDRIRHVQQRAIDAETHPENSGDSSPSKSRT